MLENQEFQLIHTMDFAGSNPGRGSTGFLI